jgi:hypothetical protein
MELKVRVPIDPTRNTAHFWIDQHYDDFDFPDPEIPVIKEPQYPAYTSIQFWTLSYKLHKFLRTYDIKYGLEFVPVNEWYIEFLSKKDMMMFKLYWISSEDVYNNF